MTDLDLPHNYEMSQTPSNPLLLAKLGSIQALFDSAYSTVLSNLTNIGNSTGFQLALWEILYETDPALDIKHGEFRAKGIVEAEDAATVFLTSMLNYTGPKIFDLTFFDAGTNSQFLINAEYARNTPPAVPLPAAVWMLAAGIAGLGLAKCRNA